MASERAKRIRQRVIELRDAPRPADRDPDDPLDQALRGASLPEILALVIAMARSDNLDEVEYVEMFLRGLTPAVSQQELTEWGDLLQVLGYRQVASMMRRLKRTAPSRPPPARFKIPARRAAI